MTTLRPYQHDIVSACRDVFREGWKSTLVQLPTGGGKTVLGSFMVEGSSKRGLSCLWLVHRRELLNQASRTFYEMGIEHGLIAGGGSSDARQRVQLGSVQTVARRLDTITEPDLIVFDEAHHCGAAQWQAIWNAFPKARKVGLTATPWRLDGVGLGRWFDKMVQGPSVAELMEQGSLSRYRLFAPTSVDTSAVGTAMGDYKRDDLARLMDKPSITGDAVQHYQKLASGKRAVAFAVSVEHAHNIAAQFQAVGIAAEAVDGTMALTERDAAVARFVSGETLILANAELFGEGFDVPAIEAAILLRPTKSLSLHLQQVGRALRSAPGKDHAIILDHAGNSIVHGLPDDECAWSLDDRERKRRGAKAEVPVRQCKSCFFVYRPAQRCPSCGHQSVAPVRVIEQREGELAELKRGEALAKRKEVGCARSLDDLISIGRERGYKNPAFWAQKVMAGRGGRNTFV